MLRELYYGKVIPWERHGTKDKKQLEILRKIDEEEHSFIKKLSADEQECFQKLDKLHAEIDMYEEANIFAYGFAMGAMLMLDVRAEADAMKTE